MIDQFIIMNADLEAAIAEGRRRMKQFEEKTAHQLDMFDREVDNHHHKLGHKYSSINEDLKPVSWPLWGVVLETSTGQQIYKDHVSFDLVAKCPRHCACTSSLSANRPIEAGSSIPSVEAKAIIEGRRWGVDKYLYDDGYVSNPPYGIVMKKSQFNRQAEVPKPEGGSMTQTQPNTKLVSQYWRRKWKIPNDW